MKHLKLSNAEFEEITRLLKSRIKSLTYDSEVRKNSLWNSSKIISFGSADDKQIQEYDIKAIERNENRINLYKSILTK